jgi:methionine-rich copper-binding protein CopC
MIGPTMTGRRSLLLGVLCLALGAPESLAHATLTRSEPGRRAVLARSPAQIRLWFSERIERGYSSISVLDAAGHTVSSATATVSPDDPMLLVLDLPTLAPGQYTVHYRVNSVDGHIVDARYVFTVEGAGR